MIAIKAQLITFLGYTGVGKSTQIRLLACCLRKGGAKIKCARVKAYYPLTRLVLKYYGKKHSSSRWISSSLCHSSVPYATLLRSSIALDLVLNTFSLLAVSVFRIHIFLRFKYVVLVEEYVLETITDYVHAFRTYGLNFRLLNASTNLLYRFIPKEAIVVILVADHCSLRDRWIKRKTVFEHPEYLKAQRNTVKFCQKNGKDCICIKTDKKSTADIHDEILSELYARNMLFEGN